MEKNFKWNFPIINFFRRRKKYEEVHNEPSTNLPIKIEDHLTVQGFVYSKKGMDQIIYHEVGGEAYYRKKYHRPCWPKGVSGVTIGIGYDLGQVSLEQFNADWGDKQSVDDKEFALLKACIGLRGKAAKKATARIAKDVSITFEDAMEVFYESTVPKYHWMMVKAFPGIKELAPLVKSVLLSIVYNRGASMGRQGQRSWNTRREMREIRDHVKGGNLRAIAASIRSMKRLWVGKGQDGLLVRRDKEADMVLSVADLKVG